MLKVLTLSYLNHALKKNAEAVAAFKKKDTQCVGRGCTNTVDVEDEDLVPLGQTQLCATCREINDFLLFED